MRQRPFQQVDVFTATPYLGNPLAVVLDAEGLATEAMQQFTNWTNLSEATASSAPAPSCPLPATPRWAPAMPGCRRVGNRARLVASCRNAAWAWSRCARTASAWPLPRHR